MPIKRLSRDAIERISAGEVVERPASVVKELLENSLDAGARRISVDISGDGPDRISVKDDGSGIPADELALALERHTTSKITGADDLWRVSTYGFRGEALVAAASISRLTLASRVRGASGFLVTSEGGVAGEVVPASLPEGTSVLVENLFYNTPARRKFMRSQRTEAAAVARVVSDAALARMDVAFTLTHGGRNLLELPPASDPRSRLAEVFSHDEARRMLHASGTVGEVRVEAYLTPPEQSRATSSKLTIIVNGRPVSSKGIFAGVMAGYGGRLLRGRYPVGFVSVSVPPGRLDVNVSPTKSVVKFSDESAVFSAVAKIIRSCVESSASAPEASAKDATPQTSRHPSGQLSLRAKAPRTAGESGSPAPLSHVAQMRLRRFGVVSEPQADDEPPRPTAQLSEKAPLWPARILGQAFESYIIAEAGGAVVLVDQHAADERICFERLLASFRDGSAQTQRLLEPTIVTLNASEMASLEENAQTLREFGFSVEPFGPRQAKIDGVPAVMGRLAGGTELRTALDEMFAEGLLHGGSSFADTVLKMVACKAAVKANRALSEDEMERILRELQSCENPYNCPHGRPTHIRLQKGRLERDFLRAV